MEIINNRAGQRHWGSYDAVDHGYDARIGSPFGQEQGDVYLPPPAPAPAGPDWGALLSNAVQQRGQIRVLTPAAAQAVLAALAFMSPPGAPPGTAPYTEWRAVPATPNAWAQSYLAAGYTLLIDRTSPVNADGSRDVALVPPGADAPHAVVSRTSTGGRWTVVGGPESVLTAAAAGGGPEPVMDCYMDGNGNVVCPSQGPPPVQSGLTRNQKFLIFGGVVLATALVAGWFSPRYR